MVEFACPHCKTFLSHPYPGDRMSCPRCAERLDVPLQSRDEAPLDPRATRPTLPDPPVLTPADPERTVEFDCTRCGMRMKATREQVGTQARCPGCNTILTVPRGSSRPAVPVLEPADRRRRREEDPPIIRDDDYSDGGRRYRPNPNDETAMVLAIVSIVSGILGLFIFPILFGPTSIVCGSISGSRGNAAGWVGMVLGILDLLLMLMLYGWLGSVRRW